MPRHPDVQTLAVANNQRQAELVAKQLDVPVPDDMQLLGEEPAVIRVIPVGGQWLVQSWPKSSLVWEAEDAADVPFELQGASVAFP
jgi:hypothetical protein